MTEKTWNLTLTPPGEPATTHAGVPADAMADLLRTLMRGGELDPRVLERSPELDRVAA
jgi:hypothetical protein